MAFIQRSNKDGDLMLEWPSYTGLLIYTQVYKDDFYI